MSRYTSTDKKKKRSNSSFALRNQLKESFVIIPDIKDTVSILSYIQLARNLYYSSIDATNKGDLRRAYIDLYKFQKLVLEKIPTHIDYRCNSSKLHDDKRWLEQIKATAMHSLELVVQNLDNEEDIRLLHLDDYNLIDEFDSLDVNNNHNHHNHKSSPAVIKSSTSSANYYNSSTSSLFDTSLLPIPDDTITSVTKATTTTIEQPNSTSSSSVAAGAAAATATPIAAIPTINQSNIVKTTLDRRDLNRISSIFNSSTPSSSSSSSYTDISPTISTSYPTIPISTESNNNNNNNNTSMFNINNTVHGGSNAAIYSPSQATPSYIISSSSSNFLGEIEWEIINKLGSLSLTKYEELHLIYIYLLSLCMYNNNCSLFRYNNSDSYMHMLIDICIY